jgi:hypothetical protein
MRDVFVSRPTSIAPEFVTGFDAFSGLLRSHELNPRTLGVSEYPTESPLDEVIAIMNQCVGAVILGYPQIRVEKGDVKGKSIDPSKGLVLATEWNHIEAGLAYAKKLPLLVIHHRGVCRGIFDRGACNKFLHEIDLTDSTWAMREPIIGAIATWKSRLLATPSGENNEAALSGDLVFEPRSGTRISRKTRVRYCQKCYKSSPSREVELYEGGSGWRCSVCGEVYANPDWRPPPEKPYDPFGFLER